jgi:hypothetical protein
MLHAGNILIYIRTLIKRSHYFYGLWIKRLRTQVCSTARVVVPAGAIRTKVKYATLALPHPGGVLSPNHFFPDLSRLGYISLRLPS